MALRVAVLVKQVPRFDELRLGPDGRLERAGMDLELNPYCRRAVAKAVDLVRERGGSVTVFTLGPPAAEDALREAVAWGADEGVLITDPAFAGSDTLATARALAGALRREGPWDLILSGRNSVDADTGQVPPELAELLGLPFLAGVRELEIADDLSGPTPSGPAKVSVRCEYDDGWARAEAALPIVLSCAERLCEPAKVDPEGRAAVAADRIRRLGAGDVGPGPWGQAGSPTAVGQVRTLEVQRQRFLPGGTVAEQVAAAVAFLRDRGALGPAEAPTGSEMVSTETGGAGPAIGVVVESGRPGLAREVLGRAAELAATLGGRVIGLGREPLDAAALARWGADEVVAFAGPQVEEDLAAAIAAWSERSEPGPPWAILAGGTLWGREVASRVAARLGAGLTGDAVDLDVAEGRLVCWKPAFGGSLVAAITANSPVQLATVRPGILPRLAPRLADPAKLRRVEHPAAGRIRILESERDDELDALARADVVVGVGTGIPPDEYPDLHPLLGVLGAELAATRKVTDKGWLPRARQVGITGRSIGPRLYVAIGIAGKFNHTVGIRGAGAVLAINRDPEALIFAAADAGIVADWHDALPLLVAELRRAATVAVP
jgi:electron transfer flavoprotein alpha subunit